jgi:O-antigen/teichoic acid export membrane protein
MSVKRNLLIGWVAHAATLVVGLYLVRFVKETLGDDGYGAWIFVNSIAGYSGLLYMGFGAAVCRYTAKLHTQGDWPALNRIVSSIFGVYAANSGLALIAAGVLAACAGSLSDWAGQSLADVQWTFLVLGLNVGVGLWGSVFAGVLIGIQRIDIQRTVLIAITLLRLALVVTVLSTHSGLLAMAVTFLGITVVENLAYLVIARRLLPQLRVRFSLIRKDSLRECFGFTSFNALRMVSEYLIYLTDTVVIGCVLGTAATVPYYIALRLCQMAHSPLEQIAEVLLPKSGELHARGEHERLRSLVLQAAGVSLLLVGGFAIGCVFLGERLLETWLGPGNEASYPILLILSGATILLMPLRIPKSALMGMGHNRVPALIDAAQAIANLMLSLLFVRQWGVLGVAIGTLIPVVICELGAMLPYCCRMLQIPIRRVLRESVLPQVVPLLLLWSYCAAVNEFELANNWWNLLAITAGGAVLTIGAAWIIHRLRQRGTTSTSERPDTLVTEALPRGASASVTRASFGTPLLDEQGGGCEGLPGRNVPPSPYPLPEGEGFATNSRFLSNSPHPAPRAPEPLVTS